ncbi:Bug family tripartite tricarboxylate transporter substrate binding protein [Caenimonas aquaedulcis]|uniref:Tripartite tricarboxylate transporter substrate binding protein n=1 Tax=Caenimonas aquaedulcis TaxID=2793270 RepID=A0A931H0N0_9BURK|nr:tripartite tricarboxylate transporter substrate binding protein [Caenimonas aquaedulcis]MBG9386394.1 tripartite tricarboxylate transporter substrate binding protein [Caenimonas aquaedulcis]
MTPFTRRQFAFGGAALAAGIALPARAAGYPERDITFVNPWSPGGSTDAIVRQYSKQMEKVLGGNIVVTNLTGGSGTIGVGSVIRAKPDGYTIGYAGNGTLVYQPMVMKGLAWAKPDDFQPLVKLNSMPTLLAVRADSPVKNWADFIKDVQARPNQVRVGVAGLRTSADLEMQQVNMAAKTKMRIVPFTGGSGESVLALLGGRVEAMAGYTDGLRGHVEAGAMRVIAVFQKGRYEPFPEAAPVGDQPGFTNATLLPACNYVIAPKGLPKDVLDKLASASKQVVTSDEFKAFAARGGLVLDPMGPKEVRAELQRVVGTYDTLLKFLNAAKV